MGATKVTCECGHELAEHQVHGCKPYDESECNCKTFKLANLSQGTSKVLGFPKVPTLKYRYLAVTGPSEMAASMCARLEDEGFDILSVSAFIFQPQPGMQVQFSQITGRIPRDTLPTKIEQEVEAESKRMVKPIVGNIK